jgi:hypothetical protein
LSFWFGLGSGGWWSWRLNDVLARVIAVSILQMPGAGNSEVAFVRFYLRSPEGTYWTLRVEKETSAGGELRNK